MNLKVISTAEAPAAIGPYSQAIQVGNLVFCSGQIPLDPATGEIVQGDVVVQAEMVMKNIAAMLKASGADFCNVKTTIFLTEMTDFAAVNEVYGRYFSDHKPARSTVAVKALPKGAQLEIEVIIAV
jgi:2-iminobutanoate/2-iminopropanoate deaminase